MNRASPRMSLRARLLLGAVLWTCGLFTAIAILMTFVVYNSPRAPQVFHHMFSFAPLPVLFAVVFLVGAPRPRPATWRTGSRRRSRS
jgi:hypothetical protein